MKKVIFGLFMVFVLGFSSVAHAAYDSEIIYSFLISKQYTVYDKVTGNVIVQCAYEPEYVYDTNEYDMIAPMDLNTHVITENTKFSGITFSADDVRIIDSESGREVIPGKLK